MSMSTDWSDLPPELLSLIFEKVADSNISNLSNCAGVCVSWCSVRDQLVNNFSPIILFSDEKRHYRISLNDGHYRIFNTGIRETQEIILPELCGKLFRSVWPGWLLTRNYESPNQVSFLNPLTRAQISLPRLWGDIENYVNFIVVLSSSPSDSRCILFGAYPDVEEMKGFCRPGDETWSTTTLNYMGKRISIWQAIYFKGDFYITGFDDHFEHDFSTYIYRIQINENNMTPTIERLLCLPKHSARESYLVELMGELLLVAIYHHCYGNQSLVTKLEIHKLKLKLNGDDDRWVRVRSLGGKHAIYICRFQSVSIYVGQSNSRAECQPNCVYVLGNPRIENVVFDVETGGFKKLCGFPSWPCSLDWFKFQ